jgi:hypothetical protein
MSRVLKGLCGLVCVIGLLPASVAEAQVPPAVTSLFAGPAKSMGFSWVRVPTATHYYLWVADGTTGLPRFRKWYTALELSCGPGQYTVCEISVPVFLEPGNARWWIQTWNPSGYGPWTTMQTVAVPGPLFAVVSQWGVLMRGNAVGTRRLATGSYEVLFSRDVSNCAFLVSRGATNMEAVTTGFLEAARRSGNPNGVFVYGRNITNTGDVDIQFHLSVECP